MKKYIICLVMLLLTGFVYAETEDVTTHTLSFGVNAYYYNYHEKLTPPSKSNEIGWLPGFLIDYGYRDFDYSIYIRTALDFTVAETTYDGSVMDINTGDILPYEGTTKNIIINVDAIIGYMFQVPDIGFTGIPYGGVGYHFWLRDIQGSGGYSEYYRWSYFQLGLLLELNPAPQWTVGFNTALKMMFNSSIKVNLSDLDEGYNDPVSDLGNKPGFRVSLPVVYSLTHAWRLTFSPWYEYSAIGQGKTFEIMYDGAVDGYGYEPASRTHQAGLTVMISRIFDSNEQ